MTTTRTTTSQPLGRPTGARPLLALAVDATGPTIDGVRAAARAGLDLVTLDDAFAPRDAAGHGDALLTLAAVAPAVPGIGLVPTVTTTFTEPFLLATATATLDHVSAGRAGWLPRPSLDPAEAAHLGRRPLPSPEDNAEEWAAVVDAVVRLWDSWEDDAEIRDVATARFVDRAKLHYVDVAHRFFSVKGPSIVPRPPQGHPVTVVDTRDPGALAGGARWGDVFLVGADDRAGAGDAAAEVRAAVADRGRDPHDVRVLLDTRVGAFVALPELRDRLAAPGIDGLRLVPAGDTDLEELAGRVLPALRPASPGTAGPGATLRDRLGLPHAANVFAPAL